MSISAHRLMAWMSPSFPTGAFAYSHGLEQAIANGDVTCAPALEDWIRTCLRAGAARNDAILLAQAYRRADVAELACALSGCKERLTETLDQGRAFARTASALLGQDIPATPLPVAVGLAAQRAALPLADILPMYLHGFAANLISAGIRLIPIGQTDGQLVLQNLFADMDIVGAEAMEADLDALGSCSITADIAAMQHEDMTTRIFRT